jgi:chemotaxis protein MotC
MRSVVLLIIILLSISACAQAQDLADSVRTLNAAQNRMAVGKEKAKDQVAAQFETIEALIPTLEPEAWTQSRNIRAAIIYLLGGGAPENLREIHDAGFIVGDEALLLEAALLNAEGDERAAEKIATFDPQQYPPLLGGHLALVQGGMLVGQDNAHAIAKLDLARLLMPTSLVEEAALRREIRALDLQNQREKIIALASIYAARYRASPYARHLVDDLRTLLRRPEIEDDPTFASKLEPVLDMAPASERLDIYLSSFRAALARGRLEEARQRLIKAIPVAQSVEARERLRAYQELIAGLDAPNGPKRDSIGAAPSTALTPEDRQIIELVNAVLNRLATSPTEARGSEQRSLPDDETELVAKARVRLEHVDILLNGKRRK